MCRSGGFSSIPSRIPDLNQIRKLAAGYGQRKPLAVLGDRDLDYLEIHLESIVDVIEHPTARGRDPVRPIGRYLRADLCALGFATSIRTYNDKDRDYHGDQHGGSNHSHISLLLFYRSEELRRN